MRLVIRDNADHVSKYIAEYIKRRILEFNPSAEKPFVIGLPTGGSPVQVYKRLVESYKAGEVSFEHVISFNMDEYVGLPRDHPESYHSFMWRHLFSHIDIKPENVNILNGNAPDLEAECLRYEEKIRSVGGIELFLGDPRL
ncbi:Glucosamine-6-phosphate isomerase (Glucosamine-6-phosphate deaminase) (GNPDA) (GlcN6P deaminase) [Basidiobolus ranarum]|uniref:glucosamine-6-phosphate deaminase n=1 Tax=Basidiobolus ranarum TaxID=34480 RepID=A0ABR2W828_9FUNG